MQKEKMSDFNFSELEGKIVNRGKDIFQSIQGEAPSVFNKGEWVGKVMDWSMQHEGFKINLFRFVDVFPVLRSGKNLTRHIEEYFGEGDDVPAVLKAGAKTAKFAGALGGKLMNVVIEKNIKSMAGQFIIGETGKEAMKNMLKLREQGFGSIMDLLGEATVSDEECIEHFDRYINLLDAMGQGQSAWSGLETGGDLDWGYAPRVQISVKITAMYSQIKPVDFEHSVEKVLERLMKVYDKVIEVGGSMCIDMESYKYKDITLEVFKRLRSHENYRHYKHLGIVLQAYLQDTDRDLEDLLSWAKGHQLPIEVRLVKGAYWDYETILADLHGWKANVYKHKPETDMAFERLSRMILENSDICYFACGSHNVRSIANVLETAKALNVPEDRYEFQVLYGMAEPVRKGVLKEAGRVRLYCPYGEMIPGMGYLVRRLLENTANESFLRQSFVEGEALDSLLQNPKLTLEAENVVDYQENTQFKNEPDVDFTIHGTDQKFIEAVAAVRKRLGRHHALHINGKDIKTDATLACLNPNKPSEIVGEVSQATQAHAAQSIEAASNAFADWRDSSVETRTAILRKAAQILRDRIYEMSAWQVLEVGKQWDQAYGDITEGIDFLEYYAQDMESLESGVRLSCFPGETNVLGYEGMGVAVVVSPWNFPLAISIGMVSAALVTGNTVVYKPSGNAAVIGRLIADVLIEAGIPKGVFNFVPGRGSEIGDYLIEHKDVSCIAFTGSMEVGQRILSKAAIVQPGQRHVKRVICEMGGKNAIIVDDDADLDEAIPGIIYSAFGFQGQKCSACSRLIVLEEIYDRTIKRLVKGVQSQSVGSPEDPEHLMGAVVSESAYKGIMEYQEIAASEGNVLCRSDIPSGEGYYAPMLVVDGITPEHRIAQEEVFGPVLAVMKAKDFTHALELANSTRFGLTGGVFSRSPKNLERARKEFRVGNLYLNRGCTGALVGRQAFGGAYMSGAGTKAGGPDYLRTFMIPKVVTENTMRRGFAPDA